ncbi:MAG: HAD family hydrolase [Fimbriimonadaceae bacterium]|nr:HAD family hydrolase [Fimbriimonadaceae bacterium]
MTVAAVLFDLDGTLLDTLQDLADSMNVALAGLGFAGHPVDAYRLFVGDGIHALARRVLPADAVSSARTAALIAAMEAEYGRRYAARSRPYPGIAALLEELLARGLPLAVFSNKPDPFTQRLVAELLAPWPFAVVRGARPDTPVKPDPAGALAVAAALGVAPGEVLYLGDSAPDMHCARRAGMRAIGAAWGFRPVAELHTAGAERVIHAPQELLDLLDRPIS